MNVAGLENELRNNYDKILLVLLKLGFQEDKIRYNERQNLIMSTRPEDDADNPNGVLIYINSLNVIFTTRSWSGNIFSLTMKIKNCNFPNALNLIANWLNYKDQSNKPVKLPFQGFYTKIVKNRSDNLLDIKNYSEKDLPPADSLSQKFLKDGVSLIVQEQFGIRFNHEDNSILIPIIDYYGNLVGCKARNNDKNCLPNERFWAYLPYPKSLFVYGWYENFQYINKKQMVIIVEAEKGVLQAASFGCHFVIAIGGHNISSTQAKYIKMLGVKKIVVAFDEGISRQEIENECKKLVVENKYYSNEVYYLYDKDNIVIPKNSKGSPVDYGGDNFKKLYKEGRYKYE